MCGGGGRRGSLEFCNTSGRSEKFYSYSRGITRNFQNLKNFHKGPLPVKNDTSLSQFLSIPKAFPDTDKPHTNRDVLLVAFGLSGGIP